MKGEKKGREVVQKMTDERRCSARDSYSIRSR